MATGAAVAAALWGAAGVIAPTSAHAAADYYQASYLIAQAVGELCQAQIWQLRRSAAGYQPPA